MNKNLYAALQPNCDADIILMDGDNVYRCYIMPGYEQKPDDAPVEELPIWRIELVKRIEVGSSEIYHRLYPNGNSGFCFAAAQCQSYTYEFRK